MTQKPSQLINGKPVIIRVGKTMAKVVNTVDATRQGIEKISAKAIRDPEPLNHPTTQPRT